ncbi:ATP-grasp domain-containing protein [Nocardia gipuzkoensis]|uniref:ATP-grasp domain-containing protein n=1 Tax=Nocardia gipuzkoensis TaxID=2749991 RepID=UPI00237D9262|nr:ATP-grasp domain-containing protein [Nocardia gipuzkoensis]MDE1675334.1 ATP-grasp domain-containing protein [Nocardia gipuzkoensis]
MKRGVLLINTGKSGPVSLLEQRRDIDLYVITERSYAHLYSPATEIRFVSDVGQLDEVWAQVLEIGKSRRIDGVIAASERSVRAAGYVRSELRLPGTKYATANAFSNKVEMKSQLRIFGAPVADFVSVTQQAPALELVDSLGWPIIVKPALGSGSGYCFVVESLTQYRILSKSEIWSARFGKSPEMIAEKFIDISAEYHCDAVIANGKQIFLAAARYRAPVLGGIKGIFGSHSLRESHPVYPILAELHTIAIDALGLRDGITHMEVLQAQDRFMIGEIACRPGGGGIPNLLEHQYGLDVWQELIRVSLGEFDLRVIQEAPGIVVQCMLPIGIGRIREITSAAELFELDHVVDVEMFYHAGDIVAGDPHYTECAGLVLFRVDTEQRVEDCYRLVEERYHFSMSDRGPGDEAEQV